MCAFRENQRWTTENQIWFTINYGLWTLTCAFPDDRLRATENINNVSANQSQNHTRRNILVQTIYESYKRLTRDPGAIKFAPTEKMHQLANPQRPPTWFLSIYFFCFRKSDVSRGWCSQLHDHPCRSHARILRLVSPPKQMTPPAWRGGEVWCETLSDLDPLEIPIIFENHKIATWKHKSASQFRAEIEFDNHTMQWGKSCGIFGKYKSFTKLRPRHGT